MIMGLIKWLFGAKENKSVKLEAVSMEKLNRRNQKRQRWSRGDIDDWHCCICGIQISKPYGLQYCLCGGCRKRYEQAQASNSLTVIDGLDDTELFWLWRNQQCITMDCFIDHIISEETAQMELKDVLAGAKRAAILRKQNEECEIAQAQTLKLEQQQFDKLDTTVKRLS